MDDTKYPIYEAAEDSTLLASTVASFAYGQVLDMGTGSGIQALTALDNPLVKSVLAVDINPAAITALQEQKETLNLSKLSLQRSDLFSSLNNPLKFDTIIFNPPYLPQDKVGSTIIKDPALYGGKHGYETIVRFVKDVGEHLAPSGQILLLFSSYTNKEKVEEAIGKNLFDFEELERSSHAMFETLYVYRLTMNSLQRSIRSLGATQLRYHARGKRGLVYSAIWDANSLTRKALASRKEVTIAIKVTNPRSEAQHRLRSEAYWLRTVNKLGLGPRFYYLDKQERFVFMQFIEGVTLPQFLESSKEISSKREVLLKLLDQCYALDAAQISKEELHRPFTNVIVSSSGPILLDFERCHRDPTPQNVTQFMQFLANWNFIEREQSIEHSKVYKQQLSSDSFTVLKNFVSNSLDS